MTRPRWLRRAEGTDIATPSRWRRVDGVEVDANERAVNLISTRRARVRAASSGSRGRRAGALVVRRRLFLLDHGEGVGAGAPRRGRGRMGRARPPPSPHREKNPGTAAAGPAPRGRRATARGTRRPRAASASPPRAAPRETPPAPRSSRPRNEEAGAARPPAPRSRPCSRRCSISSAGAASQRSARARALADAGPRLRQSVARRAQWGNRNSAPVCMPVPRPAVEHAPTNHHRRSSPRPTRAPRARPPRADGAARHERDRARDDQDRAARAQLRRAGRRRAHRSHGPAEVAQGHQRPHRQLELFAQRPALRRELFVEQCHCRVPRPPPEQRRRLGARLELEDHY